MNLPVKEVIPEILEHLNKNNTLIVSAPPGAGKSTLLPLALMNEPWLQGKKIILLEPRRLAARTIALRMASLLSEEIGESVGFRIRFDNRVSRNTRIEVVTEGILTRMLQNDNALEDVGMVIFDEFHERSIFADTALVLTQQSQEILRPDLRIMVMSATLNLPQLSEILKAPVVESQGRQYPVDITYTGTRDVMFIAENVAAIISRAVKNDKGDILAFLPGEGEIRKCEDILKKSLDNISIHPLYGQLPSKTQIAAILPHSYGKRKVVLATSIAETSLTIEGVSIVVDSGYGRNLQFDSGTGLSRLTTIEITLDAANQRAGRAGRLGPGKCYRLWSLADEHRMQKHRVPEIETCDLASVILDLAVWGITDIFSLNWPTPPPKSHVDEALMTLHQLEALDNNRITAHGKEMAALPCHPRIAHMLLMANDSAHLPLAADLAAVLEERDPMPRETGIDVNLRVEELRRQRQEKRNNKRWNQIINVAEYYHRMFNIKPENKSFDPYDTGMLLVHAYPERIASARPGNDARFQLSNGSYAIASHKDDLAHEPWLSVAHMDARQGMGKIFLAAPLNPADLKPLIKTSETIIWDTRKGGLAATRNLKIGSLVLQSKPLNSPDPDKVTDAICDAINKEGENLLNFSDETKQWQSRIRSLKIWNPEENWPDVTTATLLKTCKDWLHPYLSNIKRNEDLKKIDLLNALHFHLPPDKQTALERLAPTRIKVPSGSFIKIIYQYDASAPVLAVRLQEIFGMAETPTINDGKIPVLLHLLSPGFKPVQVTSDLRSFWNNTYFEVKKELKNRYPKHLWPDNPWEEKAIRGTKRNQK